MATPRAAELSDAYPICIERTGTISSGKTDSVEYYITCICYLYVASISLHTIYSTASFLLKIDISFNGNLLRLYKTDTCDAYLCPPDEHYTGKRIYETTLRKVLEKFISLGVHNIGRMRCSIYTPIQPQHAKDDVYFEVDFAKMDDILMCTQNVETANYEIKHNLADLFKVPSDSISVCCILYLATAAVAQRQCRLVEVTTDNYRSCVSMYRDAMVFSYRDRQRPGIDLYNIHCVSI